MEREKGITLIALVITIIVLLILAGVSVATLVGDNGILNQASRSVVETKKASAKEQVALAWSSVDSEYWGAWSSNTSKQRTEYFNEANLNKYLESTGTVTNLVYNPGGVSTLTYTSKTDNLAYEFQIDSSGKVSGASLVSKVTSANYGDKVNYTANGVSDWRIFYNDGSNVFIIATDYLAHNGDNTKIVPETGMTLEETYRAYWSSAPSSAAGTTDARKFSPVTAETMAWTGDYSINENGRAVSTLLDTSLWNSYVDSNLADMAIGSSTLNMWIASWNAKYPEDKIYCNKSDSIGYYIGTSTEPTSTYIDISEMSAKAGYQVEEANNMYYPYKGAADSCNGYWLASPSASGTSDMMFVGYSGNVGYYGYYSYAYYGVRPVVCLQSSVNGTKSGDTWNLSK